jgi:flagellar hook-basal body complex protein FliE
MVSPVIQTALSQMQNLATEAAGERQKSSRLATSVGEGGFAEELHSSIVRINELQQVAREKGIALQAGDDNVSLSDVMIDSQKASVAFEMGVQVRNRLINAYKEIMNMQV